MQTIATKNDRAPSLLSTRPTINIGVGHLVMADLERYAAQLGVQVEAAAELALVQGVVDLRRWWARK
jgi:hypothetical protein